MAGICTRCGYLSDDGEVHDCTDAHVAIGKKAWAMAQDQAVADGEIQMSDVTPVLITPKEL
jgi:hypothetical protein